MKLFLQCLWAFAALFAMNAVSACSYGPDDIPEEGVSERLALERAAFISKVQYELSFDLCSNSGINSTETLSFEAADKKDVVLDFKVDAGNLLRVEANGNECKAEILNEHIIIPRKFVKKGANAVSIKFIAGEQSLNRRDNFMYTLLVPDRARTLFPCFDQPDMKACFKLTLNVPEEWKAVSNTNVACDSLLTANASRKFEFAPTEPLSTYLFSFVAGEFKKLSATRNGRTISMYHRENDESKLEQTDAIFTLVFDALDYMEEYTGTAYPFAKYDFIVLPDFQYGGMEHTGATLYNDKRIFLGPQPTTDELLERASLIAHETAHMWFGDYVTMKWFNDVWTKEVFANWFAYRIVRPAFPQVNHTLSDLKSLYASAYSEDRTSGSGAISRPLDNLNNAGLIYSNIIYDKAPIVMDMLARKLGEDNFREALRVYLKKFAYSNATWDALVEIFDTFTDEDLRAWSDVWVKEPDMPLYTCDSTGNILQKDPRGKGRVWEQDIKCEMVEGKYWIPNVDGKGYGWFRPDSSSMAFIMEKWSGFDETARMSLLMTLYENSVRNVLDRCSFVDWCARCLDTERNPLIFSSLVSYGASENFRCEVTRAAFSDKLESLAETVSLDHELRLLAFREYMNSFDNIGQLFELYSIWKDKKPFAGLSLSENDYTELSYSLQLAYPDSAAVIASQQRARITNADRLATYDFVCRAASPDSAARRELFDYILSDPAHLRPESRVLKAMSLLCHHRHRYEALDYILPALEVLENIQRNTDIFFPASWCRTLLRYQYDTRAMEIVDDFLKAHPDMNPLLVSKIRLAEPECEGDTGIFVVL